MTRPLLSPQQLLPHPDSPDIGIRSLEVGLERDGASLRLDWCLRGDMPRLCLPAPGQPRRADRLWEHSCFELFAAAVPAYREFNVAPDGAWAVYDFSGYREPLDSPALDLPPRVSQDYRPLQWRFTMHLPLTAIPAGTTRLGLSAVLESVDGERAYWALAHPGARPDFHAVEAFILDWTA